MERIGTIAVHDVPTHRARLGGTTLPDERSVWDDPGSRVSSPVETDGGHLEPDPVPELPTRRAADVRDAAPAPPATPPAPVPSEPGPAANTSDTGAVGTKEPVTGASVFDVPATPPMRPIESAPAVMPTAAMVTTPILTPVSSPVGETSRPRPTAVVVAATETPSSRRRPTRRHLLIGLLVVAAVAAAGWWWAARSSTADLAAPSRASVDAISDDTAASAAPDAPPLPITVPASPAADDTGESAPVDVFHEPAARPVDIAEPLAAESRVVVEPIVEFEPLVEQPAIEAPTIDEVAVEESPAQATAVEEPGPAASPTKDQAVEDTVAEPAAEPATDPRRIEVTPRNEPCRFGNDCLVVGFSIVGFDPHPGAFVCEFASGSRFEFRFETPSVATACMTGSGGDSITIEVADVRSETVVNG